MTLLIIGIVVFLGIHLLPTIPGLRDRLVDRFGENGYKLFFSLLSVAGFILLLIFLVATYVPGEIKARLKHPFLVAIKTWALAHLIANGDLASIILFGSFLAYAVYDRITLKHRLPTGLIEVPANGGRRNDLIAVVLGVVLYVLFLVWLHPLLIGTAPLPH
ncbi:MAG TPA: NnrU family protein [Methyloceanibacter sp.]|nr:NnrU family protein [Methyloceanibacter sp.]